MKVLTGCSIGVEGARMVSEGLKSNSTLTKLVLSSYEKKWNMDRRKRRHKGWRKK